AHRRGRARRAKGAGGAAVGQRLPDQGRGVRRRGPGPARSSARAARRAGGPQSPRHERPRVHPPPPAPQPRRAPGPDDRRRRPGPGAIAMNLSYAVERLLDTGWSPATLNRPDLERLPDGRPYPTVEAVRREFADAGFELSLKYDFTFNCCRATWSPSGDTPDP